MGLTWEGSTGAQARGRKRVRERTKMYISNGCHADTYFVAARTDPDASFMQHQHVHRRERTPAFSRS